MSTVRDEIIEIIKLSSKPRVPDLHDDNKSLFELGMDSLDYATTIMGIEEKYDLEIVESDMEDLTSLKSIVSFVERRLTHS